MKAFRAMTWRSAVTIMACVTIASPAMARETIEPRRINRPADLRAGEAALLLSIRLAVPQFQAVYLWFEADETATPEPRYLKFRRAAEASNWNRMLDRDVHVYAIPAGRWRFRAHSIGCKEIVDENAICVASVGRNSVRTSTANYASAWIVVDVPAGGLADAGELLLELPLPGSNEATPADAYELDMSLRFKQRPLPDRDKSDAGAFAAAPKGQITIAPKTRSNIRCDRPQTIGSMRVLPFEC